MSIDCRSSPLPTVAVIPAPTRHDAVMYSDRHSAQLPDKHWRRGLGIRAGEGGEGESREDPKRLKKGRACGPTRPLRGSRRASQGARGAWPGL